jgi:hypothetical protein
LEDGKSPILQIAEDVYRCKETSKLSLRLSQVMADLLTEVNHFCEENHLEISDGMDYLMGEAGKLFAAIKETQNLPFAELIGRPPTLLMPSDETLQVKKADNSDEDLPAPRAGNCQVLVGFECL